LRLSDGGGVEELAVDAILIAVGRRPNVDGLGLEAAGVRCGPGGVEVDDHLRTTNRRIYAAGDVCSQQRFTHAADFMARAVIQNAFFGFAGRKKASSLTIPRATFTDPEVAGVGLSVEDAARRGLEIATFTVPMCDVDRAVAEGDDHGFVTIHAVERSGTIVGATVVARHAGEMISEIATAMAGRIGLGKLASVIHPYPTWSEAIRKTGDLYNRTRLTDFRSAMLRRFFAWRRREGWSGAQ
jgi:pyruvate/2-oxoglutarate dehydrogenase complex dihydrolipoamide dehydrogenase (E3) component